MTEATERKRAGRRGNGEGTFRQRANGSWEGRWSAPDGKQHSVYGRTKAEARDKLAAKRAKLAAGLDATAKWQTVADYLGWWLADVAAPRVSAKTLRGYEEIVRLHLVPALGRHDLDKLGPQHVQRMLNDKRAAGLSPRRVAHLRAVLRTALNQAVRWGLVARNAASLTDAPRVETARVEAMPASEAHALLAATEADPLGPLYAVALLTGLRQGELLALRWTDVDLDTGSLTVARSLKSLPGAPTFGPPKSAASRRTLTLPAAVVSTLRTQRARQNAARLYAGDVWEAGWGLVFARANGRPLDPREVTKRLREAQERHGLTRRRFHDLRHGAATLLLAQGVPLATIRDTLGQSTITLTANLYAHVGAELRREAASAMDRLSPTGTE